MESNLKLNYVEEVKLINSLVNEYRRVTPATIKGGEVTTVNKNMLTIIIFLFVLGAGLSIFGNDIGVALIIISCMGLFAALISGLLVNREVIIAQWHNDYVGENDLETLKGCSDGFKQMMNEVAAKKGNKITYTDLSILSEKYNYAMKKKSEKPLFEMG